VRPELDRRFLRIQGVQPRSAGETAHHGDRLGYAVAAVGAGGTCRLTHQGSRRAEAVPRSAPSVRRSPRRRRATAGVLPRSDRRRGGRMQVAATGRRALALLLRPLLQGDVSVSDRGTLRAPTADGAVVAEPPLPEAGCLLSVNRQRLRRDELLLGRP